MSPRQNPVAEPHVQLQNQAHPSQGLQELLARAEPVYDVTLEEVRYCYIQTIQ